MRGFVAGVIMCIISSGERSPGRRRSASEDAAAAAFEAMSFKEKLAVCAACHGANGVSEIPGTPSLAGQPVNFMEYQLMFFRYDQRKDEVMTPYGHPLTDQDIQRFWGIFRLPASAAGGAG